MDEEKRCFKPTEELRVIEEAGQPKRIRGLAVPYGAMSDDLGGFREMFVRGAFGDSLTGEVRADVEHDRTMLLGRSSKGTLKLEERKEGLYAEITVPDTQRGRDVLADVANGNLDAMSIGFVDADGEFRNKSGQLVREVSKAKLTAVTLTAFPAYRQTAGTLALRSLEQHRNQEAEAERLKAEAEKVAAEENAKLRNEIERKMLDD